mmetsp:Transcript_60640/g.169447  ORF Transcript_60640/g.169447 Transcript_60640/m.169447 type:complete len:235 (+) Transcript_60640:625-1329(+)
MVSATTSRTSPTMCASSAMSCVATQLPWNASIWRREIRNTVVIGSSAGSRSSMARRRLTHFSSSSNAHSRRTRATAPSLSRTTAVRYAGIDTLLCCRGKPLAPPAQGLSERCSGITTSPSPWRRTISRAGSRRFPAPRPVPAAACATAKARARARSSLLASRAMLSATFVSQVTNSLGRTRASRIRRTWRSRFRSSSILRMARAIMGTSSASRFFAAGLAPLGTGRAAANVWSG